MEFETFNICLRTRSGRFQGFHHMFQVYSWTGENNYIVRGASSNLVIGSSDGGFGIWLDESFNQGRSQVRPYKKFNK